MLKRWLPNLESVAVGNVKVGPMPHMKAPDLAGEKKNEGLMSPRPNALPPGENEEGSLTIGRIVRVIRFQSLVR